MKVPVEVREQSERDTVRALDSVASQIHGEIDAYVARALRPDHVDPGAVGQSLKRILGKAADEPPSAFVIDVDRRPSLVLAYTLLKGTRMGEAGTSVRVRAYAVAQGTFRLVDATGEDLNGYAQVSLVQLHSPVQGEMWVLLSGYMTGANGPNNGIRVYAYDGAKFRTVWTDDHWGTFTVRATDRGFIVDGLYYRKGGERRDVYLLAEDGVQRISP